MSEQAFRSNIDFPGTRNYVREAWLQRYEFYRKRGRMRHLAANSIERREESD